MAIKAKKILAIVFSCFIVLSFAGCKKDDTAPLSDEIEYIYVDENGNEIDQVNGESNAQQAGEDSSKNDKESNKNKVESNKNKVESNKNNENVSSNGDKSNNKDDKNLINNGVNPLDYKNTEVIYATWRDPKLNEDKKVVEDFQNKYGIKVKTDLISEGGYTQTVLGRIAAGNAPDIFFCTYAYPACLNALQPIDAMKLNLKEAIWDQSLISDTTVNGKKYLVNTISNIWNDFDMVFYNKKIFNNNNITTPEQYVKQGKWTFDALKKCMQQVDALGDNYVGGYLNYEGITGSTGESILKMKNGKFVNGYSDKLVSVVKWVAEGKKAGYIGGIDASAGQEQFKKGNVGIITGFSWCLKKSGGLRGMNPNDIGFAPLPSWEGKEPVPTTFIRGWGLCRGAKNPVAAGIFLRYYLDVNNYDTASAFINSDASKFFFEKSSKNAEKTQRYFVYGGGVGSVTQAFDNYYTATNLDPAQVEQFFKTNMNSFNAGIAALNDLLAKVK